MQRLIAQTYDSGFIEAHDTYNAISKASDGKIYYILSSDRIDVAGKMFVLDPVMGSLQYLANLSEICGEKEQQCIPQGKSHVRFFEFKGKLYFSTHVGYYELIDGMDRLPVHPPDGYGLYKGGHILSYELKTGVFEDVSKLPNGEGVVSMTMDTERGHIFGISWPTGNFFSYDVNKNQFILHGKFSGNGEDGVPGEDFQSLCRSLVVDPRDGTVYFSTAEGKIYCYNQEWNVVKQLKGIDLVVDYFGKYDPTQPGSMGYNWRKIFWYTPEQLAYAVHGNSSYLFKFDPNKTEIEIVERIASNQSRKCGMFDQFSYGYLGFQLGPDQRTIYYLTGSPIYENGKRLIGEDEIAKGAAKGLENLHLITFDIPTSKYKDHGPIFYENGDRPLYVNSIAVGDDGSVYTLARIDRNGITVTDLICIAGNKIDLN
jgi:hypothetical protein